MNRGLRRMLRGVWWVLTEWNVTDFSLLLVSTTCTASRLSLRKRKRRRSWLPRWERWSWSPCPWQIRRCPLAWSGRTISPALWTETCCPRLSSKLWFAAACPTSTAPWCGAGASPSMSRSFGTICRPTTMRPYWTWPGTSPTRPPSRLSWTCCGLCPTTSTMPPRVQAASRNSGTSWWPSPGGIQTSATAKDWTGTGRVLLSLLSLGFLFVTFPLLHMSFPQAGSYCPALSGPRGRLLEPHSHRGGLHVQRLLHQDSARLTGKQTQRLHSPLCLINSFSSFL